MSRWQFYYPTTAETYVFGISPNQMTSPMLDHPIELMLIGQDTQARSIRHYPAPKEWTFSGVIRTQAMHDAFVDWSQRPEVVQITDHLARTFTVLLTRFDSNEQKPTARNAWRFRYTMHALILSGPQ